MVTPGLEADLMIDSTCIDVAEQPTPLLALKEFQRGVRQFERDLRAGVFRSDGNGPHRVYVALDRRSKRVIVDVDDRDHGTADSWAGYMAALEFARIDPLGKVPAARESSVTLRTQRSAA
jgi:hypothetical protein